jgi:hypothetical protein
VSKTLEIVYDDIEFGVPELGMMKRDERIFTGADGYDADDEDEAYQKFLKAKGIKARVLDGKVFVD